jgi:hypothetical protein
MQNDVDAHDTASPRDPSATGVLQEVPLKVVAYPTPTATQNDADTHDTESGP